MARMRKSRLAKRHRPIDKSKLPFGLPFRIKDDKYRQSFKSAGCFSCGLIGNTTVGAHIRHGLAGGMGLKPCDSLILALCADCHSEQHEDGERQFWADRGYTMGSIKKIAKERYRGWKNG